VRNVINRFSGLNAPCLSLITAIDIYKTKFKKEEKSERHYLYATKFFTLLWGIIAILLLVLERFLKMTNW
jgi:uncharacterized membrane protein